MPKKEWEVYAVVSHRSLVYVKADSKGEAHDLVANGDFEDEQIQEYDDTVKVIDVKEVM